MDSKAVCEYCNKLFSNKYSKTKHVKKIHKIVVEKNDNTQKHILCPLCKEGNIMETFKKLDEHLLETHQVGIDVFNFVFSSKEEYDSWTSTEKIEVNYAMQRKKNNMDSVFTYYYCNRSNLKGYQSRCTLRTQKSGETIKIHGVCPSRLISRIYENGECHIEYYKTHVGHDEEIRAQHLAKIEKAVITEKLKMGVNAERIIEDARQLEHGSKVSRLSLLSRKDLNYLSRKNAIDRKRHNDEMVAVMLKIQEWNSNGKHYAFLVKLQGVAHPRLKDEDFAVGFMNNVMKDKLIKFGNIICMDGTHCTNKKKMDLTVILVKDDRNAGFPVAFLVSNRLDQIIQEVFLQALKEAVEHPLMPQYFMTDDDAKYYNAWVNVMGYHPQKLLCSWHIIRSWCLQGRNKIKNLEMKKSMRAEMKKILNEMDREKFTELSEKYFVKLRNAKEDDFLNYLQRYYYQNEARISAWAHCYRIGAGINTNMALESMNNFLKTNQIKRRANITVERLLDKLEDLVDAKMWQRVLNMDRPNASNYQDRMTIKAHKIAAKMDKNLIEEVGFGEFKVKSSVCDKSYEVSYNMLCDFQCRTSYCRVCKICIHRYKCECPDYLIRTNNCKHIHYVCMFERAGGTNSVLDDVLQQVSGESSAVKLEQKEEIQEFIQEYRDKSNIELNNDVNEEMKIELIKRKIQSRVNELIQPDDNEEIMAYYEVMKKFDGRKEIKKRKMETQQYYPRKK